jgi:hypothetical protein
MTGGDGGCFGGSVANTIQWAIARANSGPGVCYYDKDYPQLFPTANDDPSVVNLAGNSERFDPKQGTGIGCMDNNPQFSGARFQAIDGFSYAVYPSASIILSGNQAVLGHPAPGQPDKALGAPGSATANTDREVLLAQALNHWGSLSVLIDATPLASYVSHLRTPADFVHGTSPARCALTGPQSCLSVSVCVCVCVCVCVILWVGVSRCALQTGGVITGGCSSDAADGNHYVLLVGLAKDPTTGVQHWVLQNNWGSAWGQSGYFYLQRGSNLCGITNQVSFVLYCVKWVAVW